jgi:hypothetical protein
MVLDWIGWVEALSCVDRVLVLLSLGRVSTLFFWGCMSSLDRVVVCQHSILSPFNELIFGLGFRINSLSN